MVRNETRRKDKKSFDESDAGGLENAKRTEDKDLFRAILCNFCEAFCSRKMRYFFLLKKN